MKTRALVVCLRCQQERRHNSRGLCRTCVKRCERDGTLEDYRLAIVPVKQIIEEMESWPGPPRSYVDTAKALGLTQEAAATSYWRARKAGLVPQARWDTWQQRWVEVG